MKSLLSKDQKEFLRELAHETARSVLNFLCETSNDEVQEGKKPPDNEHHEAYKQSLIYFKKHFF